ncbi:MAG: MurR/RpiR family transcriptional regulator [Firmicutes bacterium]|nr:MurR/RpiR family transcriptional regulator [Bacillota bacterium]HXL04022.1 MurR/RpiR family transcriptional regulator [Bacillota bacterium]
MEQETNRNEQDGIANETRYFASIRDTLEANLPTMSQRQAQLGRYILDHITEVPFLSAAELAERANVSEPTVIRFSRSLGYTGYQDLRKEAQKFIKAYLGPGDKVRSVLNLTPDRHSIIDKVFDSQVIALEETRNLLSRKAFWEAVEALCNAKNIFLFGQGGMSALSLDMLDFRLRRYGYYTYTLSQGGRALFENLHLMTADDTLVVITFSQPDEETAIVLNHARSVNAKTVVITDYVEAELTRESDIILFVKRGEVGTSRSYAIPLVIIEALVLSIAAEDESCLEMLDKLHQLRAEHQKSR